MPRNRAATRNILLNPAGPSLDEATSRADRLSRYRETRVDDRGAMDDGEGK
jgi:hypothetical protein